MNVLEAENLTKYYGKSRGIVNVNLGLKEGEVFGFIGPNGAGKTTTIRCLLNFIFPSGGRAMIFGMDAIKRSKDIKQQVGYLPGEVAYYGEMRVKDLLLYSASFYRKDSGKRAADLADLLDLDTSKRIETLSLGNRKKIGIIQALMHEPRLLILDEPTSGLDPLMQNRFYDLLLEENKRGTTIFFSSHILSEVQRLCNRVAILKEGRVLKVEEVEALRSRQLIKVRLTFNDSAATLPANLRGVVNLEKDGGTLRFMFGGDVNSLVRTLSGMDLTDLFMEEPNLEEVFMHYYEEGPK